ncbi:MAG: nucleoside 2-deoxyribosyltransferase [Candidatus Thorarchaeota archaeon]|jgi:nucleoside 2-deoxyribosyltransferase|nr:nucleoside 2-deoxyribosyltransferase [Candidatus Thorarchaeota archaeon]
MVQVYLSGPIIDSELRMDDFYRCVIDVLEKQGTTVFAPQFLPPVSPVHVYRRDVDQVRKSDLLIVEVSHASLGVGMEIMLAIQLKKPILLFRHKDARPLSFMVKGADGMALFEYSDLSEVVNVLRTRDLENMIVAQCPSCDSQVVEKTETMITCAQCQKKHVM